MNANQAQSFGSSAIKFDLLRAHVEREVKRSGVIAVTACTPKDGRDIAARGLAYSLATAGYSTLFVETSLADTRYVAPETGLSIEESGRKFVVPDSSTPNLAVLPLNDPTLQRTTSRRDMQSVLERLRKEFDYVVITVDYGASTVFAMAVIDNVDAALVCVRTRRRQSTADAGLSRALERLGPRYLGIIVLDALTIEGNDVAPRIALSDARLVFEQGSSDRQRHEIVEQTT